MTDNNSPDTVERVERTDVGTSLEARLKRGTSTRDEDRITIKAKGETAADTLEAFEILLARYESEYSDRLRALQPSEDNDVDEM